MPAGWLALKAAYNAAFNVKCGMGKHIHKLISKNTETATGVCANCGDVELKYKGGVWRCHVGYSSQRGDWRNSVQWGHGLTTKKCNELTATAGKCDICSSDKRKLVVDHCHESLRVRGILCVKCNWAIGHFRDDTNLMRAAIQYLEQQSPMEI